MSPSATSSPSGAARKPRAILVAIDFTAASVQACKWAVHECWRPGDVIHICHVARILSPQMTIQHGYQQTYTIPDPRPPLDDKLLVEEMRSAVKREFTNEMDLLHIPHSLALYLDTENAPASAVSEIIFKVAEEVDACLIVMACHNKSGWDSFFLGSVADYCTQNCQRPLLVVRKYTPKPPPAAASPTAAAQLAGAAGIASQPGCGVPSPDQRAGSSEAQRPVAAFTMPVARHPQGRASQSGWLQPT